MARAAREAGFQVIVATHVQNYGERIVNEGFKLMPITLKRESRNVLREIFTIVEMVKIYKAERPCIVHHVAMKPVLYGSIAANITKIPFSINALGGLGHIFISNQWTEKILRVFICFALKLLLNNRKNRVILQNPEDIELFVSLGIVKHKNIRLIRGVGVDTSRFVPSSENNGVPIVAMISRMLWDKGVREFIDAAKLIKNKKIHARFVLIGNSDHGNSSAVPVSMLESWQNEGFVEWWGHRDDMPDVFQRCHVVCLPSYREGLPKVLIEAAACGRAIVATDVPGCREIIRNGENGILVPVRNALLLADAIRDLIENPELRARMGACGRKLVENEFSLEKAVAETMAVYKELLE